MTAAVVIEISPSAIMVYEIEITRRLANNSFLEKTIFLARSNR
jgi:hypothetical protein